MEVNVKASLGATNFYTEVVAGENKLITDEPLSKGGQNKGFNPFEILATSLASCTAATLRMYFDNKKWEVSKIDVEVILQNDTAEKIAHFTRKIHLEGDLDEKQTERALKIAEACPVHKLLTNQVEVATEMV